MKPSNNHQPSEIIIVGAGGHALVVADAINANGCRVVGYVNTVSARGQEIYNGAPVFYGIDSMLKFIDHRHIGVALGFGDCKARNLVLNDLQSYNVKIVSVVHPSAIVSPTARIGGGVYVGPMAIIESMCTIGDGTIVNCAACVCHESRVGISATICPNVSIGGRAIIGDLTWVGIGATVIDKIVVGSNTYIGAGSVVVKNLPDNVLAVGVPARVTREQ